MSALEGAALEDYLCREVKNICDAEPDLVARYILALISSGDPPHILRKTLEDKLEEFIGRQTVPFIDRLFKELGYDTTKDSRTDEHHSRRRLSDYSDEDDDGDRNFKHRRQRYSSRDDPRQARQSDDRYSRRRHGDSNGYGSSSSSRYRDDHYRSNRDDHHYHHYNSSSSSMPHSRHDSRDRSRSSRREVGRSGKPLCRDYNEKGFCMRGDMCPYDHGDDRIVVDDGSFSAPFPPQVNQQQPPFFGMPGGFDAYDPERAVAPEGSFPMEMPGMMAPMDGAGSNRMFANPRGRGRGRGGFRGRGRGGMNAGMDPSRYAQAAAQRQNATLVVENIPDDHCDISKVNEFFKKFGSITNISVQGDTHKAIIQFATRDEAKAAYNCPDAIFDNRFVKVYWFKDNESDVSGAAKQPSPAPATAAAAPPTAAVAAASTPAANPDEPNPPTKRRDEPDPEEVAARAAELAKIREEKQKKHQERMRALLEVQKQREQLLQKQIQEQKRLMEKLSNTNMSQDEKKELLAALRKIANDIGTTKSNTSEDSQNTSTEDLKAKLAKVEAEAAALGIPVHGSSAPGQHTGGYRGRGGRPGMRGGFARYTLDHRPTKIFVKDVPEEAKDELRVHFAQFGSVTNYESHDTGLIVQYAQRYEAEKAMAAGANSPRGELKLSWMTTSQPAPQTAMTTDTAPTQQAAEPTDSEA